MKDKYLRKSKRTCWSGCIAVNSAILCATYSWIAAMHDNPQGSVSAGCAGVFAIFIAAIEFKESVRCRKIGRNWIRWDREAAERKEGE